MRGVFSNLTYIIISQFEGFLLWRYMKNTYTALALDCNKFYRFKILN